MVICIAFNNVQANVLTKQSTIEIEAKAKQLGRIWNGQEIRRSISLFIKASKNWKKLGEPERESFCLRESAKLSLLISDLEYASDVLKQALKLDKKTNNFEGQVISYSLLSRLEELRGELGKSESHYKKALILSKSSTDYAKAFANLAAGEHQFQRIKLKESKEFFVNALSFAEKDNIADLKAKILLNLGFIDAIKDEKDISISKINEAQDLWKQTDNKRGLALSYNALGFVYVITDQKQMALENYSKAVSMIPEDVDFLERGKALTGIGRIDLNFGRNRMAEIYFARAIENYQKAKYKYGQLAILPILARLLYLKGDLNSSENLYNKALFLSKKLKDDYFLAIIKEDFGNIDFDEGNLDEAIIKFKEANQVYSKLGMQLPRVQNSLGKVYEKKGELLLARKHYVSASKVNREIKDVVELSENLYNLARLSKIEGKTETALVEVEESLSITELLYNDVGNNSLRKSYLSNVFDRYELYINLLMKMHERFPEKGFEIEALQTSEKSRSRLMLERLRLSEADFTRDADPKLIKKEKEILFLLNHKSNTLTELLSSNSSSEEIERLSNEIKEIENDLEKIKAELKRKSPIYSEIKNPVDFNFKEFQQNILDDNTTLLEFSLGEEKSFLWLISNSDLKVFALPKREILEDQIDNLRELITAHQKLPDEDIDEFQKRRSEAQSDYHQQAQILSNQLFGKVADKLSDKRLIIVPDGKLQYFPISALPLPNENGNTNSDEPFLLTNEIIYEPSASTLSLLRKTWLISEKPSKDLLIFADPIFSTKDDRISANIKAETNVERSKHNTSCDNEFCPMSHSQPLERLHASKQESESILENFKAKNSTLISGFEATREKFQTLNLIDYKVIHFATHGLLNEKRPELSAIALSFYDEQANKRDGFIRLQDIYSLNLSADLVVLSACDTGIGEDIKGEGLMSLTNGFLQVGAKSVVSSLWKVDDYATLELMKSFYQILADEEVTPSQALRKAQIKMWKNPRYKFPFHWAAFTIQGDFQQVPKLTKRFDYSIYLLLLVFVFGLFGIYSGYKFIKPRL